MPCGLDGSVTPPGFVMLEHAPQHFGPGEPDDADGGYGNDKAIAAMSRNTFPITLTYGPAGAG